MGHGKARARCRQQTADKVTDAELENKEWRAAHVGVSVSEVRWMATTRSEPSLCTYANSCDSVRIIMVMFPGPPQDAIEDKCTHFIHNSLALRRYASSALRIGAAMQWLDCERPLRIKPLHACRARARGPRDRAKKQREAENGSSQPIPLGCVRGESSTRTDLSVRGVFVLDRLTGVDVLSELD